NESKSSNDQSDCMRGFTSDFFSNERKKKGNDCRHSVVNPKDNSCPVTGFLISRTARIRKRKLINMMGNRRCGKNPYPKQSKPGKKLNPCKLPHGFGHFGKIRKDVPNLGFFFFHHSIFA